MRFRIDINGDDKNAGNVGRLRDTNDDEERKREKEREGKRERERESEREREGERESEREREGEGEGERDDLGCRQNTLVMDLKRDENVHFISFQKTHRKDYNGHTGYTGHGNRSKSSERLSCSSGYTLSSNSHMCSDDVIKCRDITSGFGPCKVKLKKEYDGDAKAPPHYTRTDNQQITGQNSLKSVVVISPDSPGIVTNDIRKKNTAYGPSGLSLKPEYMVDRFARPIVTPLTVRKNTVTV